MTHLLALLRRLWCAHAAANAVRIVGPHGERLYQRSCGRCGARWLEHH